MEIVIFVIIAFTILGFLFWQNSIKAQKAQEPQLEKTLKQLKEDHRRYEQETMANWERLFDDNFGNLMYFLNTFDQRPLALPSGPIPVAKQPFISVNIPVVTPAPPPSDP